jgi:hypothetical protein
MALAWRRGQREYSQVVLESREKGVLDEVLDEEA